MSPDPVRLADAGSVVRAAAGARREWSARWSERMVEGWCGWGLAGSEEGGAGIAASRPPAAEHTAARSRRSAGLLGGLVAEGASAQDAALPIRRTTRRRSRRLPGQLTKLVAEATVVRVGNRVGVVDVRIFNADEADVADTVATVKAVYNITIKKDYRIEAPDKKSPSFP